MLVKARFVEETLTPDGVSVRDFEVPYDARQLTAENESELVEWCGGTLSKARHNWTAIDVPTIDGPQRANLNNWIVKDPLGRFYPCSQTVFESTFVPVVTDNG